MTRNNTDQQLDRLINWQYLLPPIKLFYKAPTNRRLLKELQEVDNQIARGDIELNDEVEMKLTDDEKTAHSNAWRTHRETTDSLKKSRGKIYSLLLGQSTHVLVDR
jgi:hypothetical protein